MFFQRTLKKPYFETNLTIDKYRFVGRLISFILLSGKKLFTTYKLYSGLVFLGLLTNGTGPERAPLPKICHTYTTMIKVGTVISYLKKIPKI